MRYHETRAVGLKRRARYYAPAFGRFISEDPVQFQSGPNLYRYVRDNPLLFTDPTGLIHQAWNEPPFEGRLHDDAAGGLEVLCTKGRNLANDIDWLSHSIFVRSVEIDALGEDADAGHIDRRDAEIEALERCHDRVLDKPEEIGNRDFHLLFLLSLTFFL